MYKNIVILTGAGISAESGIPVFRSETGLWETEKVEDVCTHEAILRNPSRVHNFYNRLRANLQDKKPNAAHYAIANLQKLWPQKFAGKVTLVTQNVDNLHEKAGSFDIIHMHGALMSIFCTNCGHHYEFDGDSSTKSVCAFCGKTALRPDIVFFGEMPYFMDEISDALQKCDLFLAIGTSGVVYPAAVFCSFARDMGARCVEFNLEKTAQATNFTDGIYGKASLTVPKFCEELLLNGTFLN